MPAPLPPSAPGRPHPAAAACAGLYLAALGLGHWIVPATASGDELFAAMLRIGPWLPVVLSWSAFVAV